MDDLSALSTPLSVAEGGPAVWQGHFAEDAAEVSDELEVTLDDYDAHLRFGPVKFAPQARADGTGVLLPSRGDWCLIAFDVDDNAQLVSWRTDDPTS